MERLRQSDVTALLRFLRDVHAIRDLDRFPDLVGSALEGIIAADYYVYAEVDSQTRSTVLAISQPAIESTVPHYREIFDRHGHENPLPAAHQGHVGALKVSDFMGLRQFRRLALYNELFRPCGVHHQMSVVLPGERDILRGVIVNRGTRDFSERERLLLDLVRPHLAQARQNAASLNGWRRALATAGHEIVCLAEEGRITCCSEGAGMLMARYMREPASQPDLLPEALDRWVGEQQGRLRTLADALSPLPPFVVDRGDKRLVIRFLYGGGDGREDVLLLDEEQGYISPASLVAIGLSPREAEVLSLVMQGRSVAEISRVLAITTHTTEKHLENIYVKLDVHSRVAAIARAWEAVRLGR